MMVESGLFRTDSRGTLCSSQGTSLKRGQGGKLGTVTEGRLGGGATEVRRPTEGGTELM